jgi:hypothetical protein
MIIATIREADRDFFVHANHRGIGFQEDAGLADVGTHFGRCAQTCGFHFRNMVAVIGGRGHGLRPARDRCEQFHLGKRLARCLFGSFFQ